MKKLFRYAILLFLFSALASTVAKCDVSLDGEARSDAYLSYSLRDDTTGVLRVGERSFTVNHAWLSGVGATLTSLYSEASAVLSPLAETAFSLVSQAFSSLWNGLKTLSES